MKKFLLFFAVGLLAVFGSLLAFLWFAMANKAHSMVKFNLNYAAQQMVLFDEQAHFDFRKTRISSQGSAPSIIVYDPILQANIGGTVYSFEADYLEVIGSFRQSYRYHIQLPQTIRLYRSDQPKMRYTLTLTPRPSLTVRSLAMKEDKERKAENYLWDQFTLSAADTITLQVKQDNQAPITRSYRTDGQMSDSWQKVHYFYSPEIIALIHMIEAMADGES